LPTIAAAVLPPPPVRLFAGDASLLVGTYKGPGRGREMVIEVTQTPQGIALSIDGAAAGPLLWVEGAGRSARISRSSPSAGAPAVVRRRNCGSTGAVAHFILKRQ
jgi:hypothetical protein